jgi:hypothetical protein
MRPLAAAFRIESGTWQLRHPSGPDAAPFVAWRASMTDEQWIGCAPSIIIGGREIAKRLAKRFVGIISLAGGEAGGLRANPDR